MRASLLALTLATGAALLAAACTITETGNPPAEPSIDVGGVLEKPSVATGEQIIIEGGQGAARSAGGTIWIANLDAETGPHTGAIAEDGSFVVAVVGAFADEYRVQTFEADGTRKYAPVDVVANADGMNVRAAPRPLSTCLTTDPSLALAVPASGEARTVRAHNGCAGTLVLSAARLRAPAAEYAIDGVLAAELTPGTTASIDVRATVPDAKDEILLIEATDSGSVTDRRPITLFVAPPP